MRVYFVIFCLFLSGCSGFGMKMKSLVSGKSVDELKSASAAGPGTMATKSFNASPNQPYRVPRRYKRMTAEKIEKEAKLDDATGSLWVAEGQTSYLFSQNLVRREGDILNVKLDGSPLRSLETKASVIKKMLTRMARRRSQRASRVPANENAEQSSENSENAENAQAGAAAEQAPPAPRGRAGRAKDRALEVDIVPTRIVERLPDGNYRVKGSQPFMIGRREFKVIAAGIVRGEDFNDNGLSASRLLDPKFDIVSIRGGGQ